MTQFVIRCSVSGGVTGSRTALLKTREGAIKTFATRPEADQHAAELMRRNNGGLATFTYTAVAVEMPDPPAVCDWCGEPMTADHSRCDDQMDDRMAPR